MLTRRTILASIPLVIGFSAENHIYQESHPLSEESANGYRLLPQRFMIAAGIRGLSLQRAGEFRKRVNAGAWLLFETGVCFSDAACARQQANVLRTVFGLNVKLPVPCLENYVEYRLPERVLVRSFEAVTPLDCAPDEALAFSSGHIVAMRKPLGLGGIIYLGSMLGPGLFAGEREAHRVVDKLRNRA